MSNRKERRKWRENTNQRAPEDFPDWKSSKKLQRKKTITTIQIHYNVEITKSKTERETTNVITAQVRSGATLQQTKQPCRAESGAFAVHKDCFLNDCKEYFVGLWISRKERNWKSSGAKNKEDPRMKPKFYF